MKTNKLLPDLSLSKIWDKFRKVDESLGGSSFHNNPEVVCLASDNSPITDENGNYTLSDTDTGRSLLQDSTYISNIVEGNFYRIVGADSVAPFSGGGSNDEEYRTAIISALSHSNLGLTEESEWVDIIEALNKAYPYEFNILPIANQYFGSWSGSGSTSFSESLMTVSTSTRSGTYGSSTYSSKKGIDLTNFKKLILVGQDIATVNGGTASSNTSIKMTGKEGTFTLYSRSQSIADKTVTSGISVEYDITNLTGEYSFMFDFYYYISDDSIRVKLTTFKLTA